MTMDQESHLQDARSSGTTTKPKPSSQSSLGAASQLTDEELYQRCLLAIRELADEAVQLRKPSVLLEAIAWELSRLVDGYGVIAAGDFLRAFGNAVYRRADVRRAQAEAEEAAQNGHRPS